MKKIVMACANYWTSPFQVGSHHFARAFACQGWKVAFISDPISPAHLLKQTPGLKSRFEIYCKGGIREENIWTYLSGSLLSPYNHPLLRSEWLHKNWQIFSFPSLTSKLKHQGFDKPDLLYFDSPTHAFLMKTLSPKYSIYRLADYNKAFQQTAVAKKHLEEKLMREVDCVIYTAKGLETYVKSAQPKRMEFVPNGVDFSHFAHSREVPLEYQNLKGPIAVYVGAIREWFDTDLLMSAARALPNMNFVLIGPNERKKLQHLPNLHLLGVRSWKEIPAYLQHATVGLIPFDVKGHPELIHRVNPLKLYEYMASGIPVVSTKWDELEHLKSPAHLASSKEEFIHILKDLKSTGDYKSFAEKHDWKERSRQIISLFS